MRGLQLPFCQQCRCTSLHTASLIHLSTQSAECGDTLRVKRHQRTLGIRPVQLHAAVNQTAQHFQRCTRAIIDWVTDVFQPRRLTEYLTSTNISPSLAAAQHSITTKYQQQKEQQTSVQHYHQHDYTFVFVSNRQQQLSMYQLHWKLWHNFSKTICFQ